MMELKLKVGLRVPSPRWGTGPVTYLSAVHKALSGRRCELQVVGGPETKGLDLVHVIDAKRVRVAELSAYGVPVVSDFHDDYWCALGEWPSPDRFLRQLRQRQLYAHHVEVMRRSSAVVVHSQAVRDSVARVLGREKITSKLFVVRHGIDLDFFAEDKNSSRPRGGEGRGPLILFVGRDLFRKGFGVLVQALPVVLKAIPSARLLVMGKEYPHTRVYARYLARGFPVEFLPAQSAESLREWYRQASLLVLPSYEEAFGLVLIEAMAAGVAVVASRTGGIPEAVEDGVSGLLHQSGNPADLAEKMIRVLSDEALRSQLVAGGKARARLFSLAQLATALEEVYSAVGERA